MRLRALLWDGRRWFELSIFFFIIGLLIGLTAARTQTDLLLDFLRSVMRELSGVGEQMSAATSPLGRAWVIFQHNASRAIGMFIVAVPTVGLGSIAVMFGNGAILGVLLGLANLISPGLGDPWHMFLAIAPHGVIELPAFFLAAGWSMRLGLLWLLPDAAGQRLAVLGRTAREGLIILAISLVLLAISAFIEANVTVELIRTASPA
jgi:stage II sporulation protein M